MCESGFLKRGTQPHRTLLAPARQAAAPSEPTFLGMPSLHCGIQPEANRPPARPGAERTRQPGGKESSLEAGATSQVWGKGWWGINCARKGRNPSRALMPISQPAYEVGSCVFLYFIDEELETMGRRHHWPKFTQLPRGRAGMGRKPGKLVPGHVLSAPVLFCQNWARCCV